ncbi:hypothetical protein ECZU06_50470 [Escherichia coli]|nr:hypothetical protein ECZU06_50470 [Escherichia coli]
MAGRITGTRRATGNALEGIASRHNDALLPLDELREVDPREAGMIAYMLANGRGKGRARTDGEVRNRRHWTLLLFSTGELSLAEHTECAGERLYAGMDVRMVQIPSDTGQHGSFEQLHGFASGQQFADTLCDRVARFHGTAFRAGWPSSPATRTPAPRWRGVTSPLPDRPDAGQRRKPGAAHRGPFCPAGGGRGDSDTERYHGLAGRLGVWGGADLPSRTAERARPYCQRGR